MIQVVKNIVKTFTATADTQVQNTSTEIVEFQTDNAAALWGKLSPLQILSVPSEITVYFKSEFNAGLATIEI